MTKLTKNRLAGSIAFLTLGILALGFLTPGCGGDDNGAPGDGNKNGGSNAGMDPFPTDTAMGFISGKVRYTGKETKPAYHRIAGQAECEKHHDGKLIEAESKLAKDGGLPNVFIEVKELKWKFEPPKEAVTLDQVNCEYIPNVVGIMVGQDLVVTSSDGFKHNVRWEGKRNIPNPRNFSINKGEKRTLKGKDWKKTELTKFQCDIHSWMSCEVHVVTHPVFTVSDADGKFTLPIKLPDGEYEIAFRHAKRGTKTIKVTIAGKDPDPITVEFK